MKRTLVTVVLLVGLLAMGLAAWGQRVIKVGPSGDYAKIQEAIAALGASINEPVVVEIADGTYDEKITIPDLAGTSSTNTLTIRRQASGPGEVKITTNGLVIQQEKQKNGILTNAGADYVTFEGLHFFTEKTNLTRPYALVVIRGESNYNTFRNCTFSSKDADPGLKDEMYNLCSYRASAPSEEANHHLVVEGCTFEGGHSGVHFTSGYKDHVSEGNQVRKCTFRDQTGFSIYGDLVDGFEVVENKATLSKVTNGQKDLHFLSVDNIGGGLIAQNVIRMDAEARCQGIAIRSKANGLEDKSLRIENNSIHITCKEKVQTSGIAIEAKSKTKANQIKVCYNSVLIDGTAPTNGVSPHCIHVSGTAMEGVEFTNNLLQNFCARGHVYTLYKVKTPIDQTHLKFTNNGAFSASRFAYVGSVGAQPAKHYKAQEWMSDQVANESTLVNEKAEFQNVNRDLKLQNGAKFQKAMPLAEVTKDIEGKVRSATPTIGAYEATQQQATPSVNVLNVSANGARVSVQVVKKSEVHYLVLPASAAAPQDADFKEDQKFTLEAGASKEFEVSGLEAATNYVVYVRIKPEGGTAVMLSTPFKTHDQPASVVPAKFNGLDAGKQSPFEDGSFSFDGVEVVASSFFGDALGEKSQSAKLTGATATAKLKDGSRVALPGFYVRSTKTKVEVELLNAAATKFEVTLPANGWVYIPLADRGPVEGFKLTGEAGATTEIDNVGAQHTVTPRIYMAPPAAVAVGGNVTLGALVSGVSNPYTLQWKNAAGEVLGTASEQTITATERATYTLEVTDATGSKSGHVTVQPGDKLAVGTFEDLGLGENTHWKGDKNEVLNQFATGSFSLPNWSSMTAGWADFGYSSETSTEFHDYHDDMRSVVGHGAQGSKTWGVLYNSSFPPSTAALTLQVAPEGAEIPGIWLTNNAYAHSSMTKGDSFVGDPIKEGDWMKVTLKADNGKSVEYYLGDYRAATPVVDRYVLDRWAWVDLSSLGKVKTLSFTIEGSRTNAHGQLYPSYVCIDDIGASRPEKLATAVAVSNADPVSVDLATLVDLPKEALYAEMVGDWTWPNGATVSLEDLKFTVKGWDGQNEDRKEFMVKLYARGVSQWLRIPVVLQKPNHLYTFAGITVEGQGKAVAKVNGKELAKGDQVQAADEIEVTYEPAAGFAPAQPEAVTAVGAVSLGSGKWRATADDFTFTVKFVPAGITLAAIDVTGNGTVKVQNSENKELHVGDELEMGALLTITSTPGEGWELKDFGVRGAEKDGEMWKVTGSVHVRATFVEKTQPPVPTVTLAKVEKKGEGTLEITDQDGKALAQGDKLMKGSKIQIKAAPAKDYELKDDNFKVFGATKEADMWTVTSDVIVSATFTKIGASDPTPVDEHPLAGVRAYPNPVESQLSVDGVQPTTHYELYNMLGTAIMRGVAGGESFTLDMGALPAGVYILRLRSADGREVALRIVRR